jgi:hypothetical protein
VGVVRSATVLAPLPLSAASAPQPDSDDALRNFAVVDARQRTSEIIRNVAAAARAVTAPALEPATAAARRADTVEGSGARALQPSAAGPTTRALPNFGGRR